MEVFCTALKSIFEQIGEDPKREGLQKTPERMLQMYRSFLTGYKESSDELLGDVIKLDLKDSEESVLIKNIPFYSLCEHHLVPFFGEVHLAYVPHAHTLGLGRIFQYIESASRRLILQENLSAEIATTLFLKLNAKALLLKMTGLHTCLALSKKGSKPTTLTTQSFHGDQAFLNFLTQQTRDFS